MSDFTLSETTAERLVPSRADYDLAEVLKTEAQAEEAERNLLYRLASSWETRVYYFDGEVNYQSLKACINTLDDWSRLDQNKPDKRMHIVFNGSAEIINANAFQDYLRWLGLKGFTITFEISGRAKVQSAIIGAGATHSLMTDSSFIQMEEVSIEKSGNTFDAANAIDLNKRLEAQMKKTLTRRSKGKLNSAKIAAYIRRKIWSANSRDAKDKFGLVDDVSVSRPVSLTAVARLPFNDDESLQPENLQAQARFAYARKMRAEAYLYKLRNDDQGANALNNGVVRFFGAVTTETANQAKLDLDSALRLSSADINLLIYSNGGNCTDGWGFINLCNQVRHSTRVLNTECIGWACSMAGVMLQCGKTRTMSKNSWLMIHRVGSLFGPTTTMAEDEKAFCDLLEQQAFELLAERSIFTAEEIREKCRANNWYISADDALKYGFIDKIR